MSDENKLNPAQLSAVSHKSGPLLIIAGAGTGKTTVITKRVEWLISEKLAKPEEILALTFTEKAASEMEERIDMALPLGYTQTWVMTFHSFCDRILRDEGLHIGLSSNFKLLSQTDSVSLFTKHLFDYPIDYFRPLGNPTKFVSTVLQHFSRLQDEDIDPKTYLDWAKNQAGLLSTDDAIALDAKKYLELAEVYTAYSKTKAECSFLDFSDLISYALLLFRARPNLQKHYQEKFKYLLVDEFQDTNFAQNQLVLLLTNKSKNITVVADDDQSVYRWRGAAVSNVIQFRTTFPESKLVVLTQNYRSTQEILDRSYDLIQHNNPDRLEIKEKINKRLLSIRKEKGQAVKFLHLDRVENEADAVASEINKLLESSDYSYTPKDIAILVRANAHAEPFIRSLSRKNIPSQFLGPGQLFLQPEIKDLVAYLKLLYNLSDDISFFRVVSQPFFNQPAKELALMGNFSKRQSLSLLDAIEKISPEINFSPEFVDFLNQFKNMFSKHLNQVSQSTAGQILFDYLQETGQLKAITNNTPPFNEKQVDNIMKFFNKLKSFEAVNSDSSVQAVLDWIEMATEVGESPAVTDIDWTRNDSVNILTIHSAKGLEFPVVFLVNLVSQRFPSTERKEPLPVPEPLIKEILPGGDYHLQEERRLFYVGMTRARNILFFTAADLYGEGKRVKKLSPFISEALGTPNETLSASKGEVGQLSLLDWQKSSSPVPNRPHSDIKINYLSYSQIETFLDCPLHYKAKYLLKLPTPAHAASSFGNTIHLTMREFYESVRRKEKPDIEKIYSRNWITEGYMDNRQMKAYYGKGQKYLKQFIADEFNPKNLPLKLEEPFTVSLGELSIGGKIDRVDQLSDGRIEIIDYKTSTKSLTEKEAAMDLQLSFYALAATLLPQDPFHRSPEEVKLSLYYFEDQKRVSTTRTKSQLDSAMVQIIDYASQIAQSDFLCSKTNICRRCDFKMLCDVIEVDS